MAMALMASACGRDGATTGPAHVLGKDFAANLRLVSGDQQIAALGSALTQPIVVKVVDAGGQPVQGATVTFSVRAGGGSISPAANVSDASGIVSSTWTLGTTLGANKAVAILAGSFVLDSTVFTATATVGAAQNLSKVSGDNQATIAGRVLPAPLVVRVRDPFGNNLSGIKVVWTPGLSSGSVSFLADTTLADGTASATWRLGNLATFQSMTATVTGVGSVGFSATASTDVGSVVTISSGGNQTASVSAALPGILTVRVTDQFGNPVAGAPITWNDSVGGGGSLSANTGISDAAGFASITWTLGVRAGQQAVRVKLTGRTETATFLANATVAFSDVIAGNFQACAIVAANNNVYCWGAGEAGQLGKGGLTSTSAASTPVATTADDVKGPFIQVRQLTGGRNSFCSLSVSRQIFCWGRVIQTAAVNNVATLMTFGLTSAAGLPTLPLAITGGEDHMCVLSLAGFVWCTGLNLSGQLGNGSFVTPALGTYPALAQPAGLPPAGGAFPQVTLSVIAAGKQHTCGFAQDNSNFLGTNNLIPLCWGRNSAGQLGNAPAGGLTDVNTPTFIAHPPVPAQFDTTSLAVGGAHTCALSLGAAWCWGSNQYGQLGTGAGARARDSLLQSVAMPPGVTFARIFAGEYHTCAIAAAPVAGVAYCWGRNDYGQAGVGPPVPGVVPSPVTPVTALDGTVHSFRSLSVGEFFTCGVVGPPLSPVAPSQTPGTVYCWGDNLFGQLGTGIANGGAANPYPLKVKFQP